MEVRTFLTTAQQLEAQGFTPHRSLSIEGWGIARFSDDAAYERAQASRQELFDFLLGKGYEVRMGGGVFAGEWGMWNTGFEAWVAESSHYPDRDECLIAAVRHVLEAEKPVITMREVAAGLRNIINRASRGVVPMFDEVKVICCKAERAVEKGKAKP